MPNVHDDDEESLDFADEGDWLDDDDEELDDNYVHQLACGHEYDDSEPIPVGTDVYCSVHGTTTVTRCWS